MIFNIIEEVGSKSNSKRKFVSFPGLPQAHGASSSFARASPGNTHPQKRKKRGKKKTRFQAGETKKNGVQTLFLSSLAFFWGWTNLLPDSSVSRNLST
jgi:hypothetical protein